MKINNNLIPKTIAVIAFVFILGFVYSNTLTMSSVANKNTLTESIAIEKQLDNSFNVSVKFNSELEITNLLVTHLIIFSATDLESEILKNIDSWITEDSQPQNIIFKKSTHNFFDLSKPIIYYGVNNISKPGDIKFVYSIVYAGENIAEDKQTPADKKNKKFEIIGLSFGNYSLLNFTTGNNTPVIKKLEIKKDGRVVETTYNLNKLDASNINIIQTQGLPEIIITADLPEKFIGGYYLSEPKEILNDDYVSLVTTYASEINTIIGSTPESKINESKLNYSLDLSNSLTTITPGKKQYSFLIYNKDPIISPPQINYIHFVITLDITFPLENYNYTVTPLSAPDKIKYVVGTSSEKEIKKDPASDFYVPADDTLKAYFYNLIGEDNKNITVSFDLDAEKYSDGYLFIADYNAVNVSDTNKAIKDIISKIAKGEDPGSTVIKIKNNKVDNLDLGAITKDNQRYIAVIAKNNNQIYVTSLYLDIYKNKDTIYNKKIYGAYKKLYYSYCKTCIPEYSKKVNIPKNGTEAIAGNIKIAWEQGEPITNLENLIKQKIDNLQEKSTEKYIFDPTEINNEISVNYIVRTRNTYGNQKGETNCNNELDKYPLEYDDLPYRCVCVVDNYISYYGVERCQPYGVSGVIGPWNKIFDVARERDASNRNTYYKTKYPSPLFEACWRDQETGCDETKIWKYTPGKTS